MSVNLSAYRAIQPVLFVQLDIPGYQILRFSDFTQAYTLNGVAYTNIGQLLSVSDSSSELRVTETEISVSLSGIPAGSVAEILNNNPKGSEITIQRGFFTPGTTNLLPVAGNPAVKFKGLVSNYAMDEEWDTASRSSSFTITMICQSIVTVLKNKVGGRRTNPYDQERYYPGDLSMSRVPTLSNSNFQFGAPPGTTRAGGLA
jgi:hypothetical protein